MLVLQQPHTALASSILLTSGFDVNLSFLFVHFKILSGFKCSSSLFCSIILFCYFILSRGILNLNKAYAGAFFVCCSLAFCMKTFSS